MIVEILKSDGKKAYDVPAFAESMTVMSILDYIYSNLDHSLAYYRHSSCCQAICGRCTVCLDGKTVLACAKEVSPKAEKITLSPAPGEVVRDLVIKPKKDPSGKQGG